LKESTIQADIMLALSQNGCIVFRNETAGAWVGKLVMQDKGFITLANAKMIQAGLTKGGSDIIGIYKATGQLLAVEVKAPNGRVTKEQENFIKAIKKANGIAGVARSVQDALDLLP